MTKKRRTSAQWQQLIDEHQHSGLSVARYCETKGIAQSNFYLWRKKLSGAIDSYSSQPKPQAVELPSDKDWIELRSSALPDNPAQWDVEVSLPHGVTLRMRTP